MNELKATHIIMVYNGEIYEDFETVPCTQLYYKKSEADKVIAHHKYKRCLAMAEMCHALYDKYSSFAADPANWESEDYYFARWRFFEKWMRKWQELAEKFKETK